MGGNPHVSDAGAVVLSTPQDVALSDVRKGVAMFQKISVPVGLMLFLYKNVVPYSQLVMSDRGHFVKPITFHLSFLQHPALPIWSS